MDWVKSKSILILALLLTNLILVFNLLDSRGLLELHTDKEAESWQAVLAVARQKQIQLQQASVYYEETLPGVRLEYQMYEPEQIAKNMLGSFSIELGKYRNDSGDEMTLENGNKLLYAKKVQGAETLLEPLDQSMAKIKAEQFLSDVNFSSADMRFWDVQQEGALTTVVFRQYYNKLFLDDAYMAVTFEGDQVLKFERKWFNPPEELSYSRRIVVPSKALFMAMDLMAGGGEQPPLRIKALELGYRLDSSSLVSSVKAGEASPYWRVLTDSGKVYYIEAQE